MSRRYLEDFAVGQTFGSGRLRSTRSRSRFSPPNPSAAIRSRRGRRAGHYLHGLAASGWHTAAITMRLLVESESTPPAASWVPDSTSSVGRGLYGLGMSSISKVKSRGATVEVAFERRLIKVRTTTLNQNDEEVQVQIANLVVPRRQSGERG